MRTRPNSSYGCRRDQGDKGGIRAYLDESGEQAVPARDGCRRLSAIKSSDISSHETRLCGCCFVAIVWPPLVGDSAERFFPMSGHVIMHAPLTTYLQPVVMSHFGQQRLEQTKPQIGRPSTQEKQHEYFRCSFYRSAHRREETFGNKEASRHHAERFAQQEGATSLLHLSQCPLFYALNKVRRWPSLSRARCYQCSSASNTGYLHPTRLRR